MIRVVIGEDSYIMREGLQEVLAAQDGMSVVGSAGGYHDLVNTIDRERPEVVVTDIRMPPTNDDEGVQLATELRTTHPEIGVVLLSQYLSPEFALRLFEDGSQGRAYLLKEHVASGGQLAAAVTTVAAGGSVVDPVVVQTLVNKRIEQQQSRVSSLTPRELEVLAQLAEGRSNGAIGSTLYLSKGAVEKHINSIFRKLDMPDETEVHRRVLAALLYLSEEPAEPS